MLLIDAAIAGDWDVFWNAVSHILLPACILGYSLARLYQPHDAQLHAGAAAAGIYDHRARKGPVRAARRLAPALGNVMVPLVTVIALSYASLLEGAVLTETVFAWPGLGRYITDSLCSMST